MPQAWIINPTDEENPRRRRRRSRSKRRRASSHRRRARARHNPANPPRHRRRRHHRARRNPGAQFFGIDVGKVGIGALGAVGSDIAGEWVLGMLPSTMDAKTKEMIKYPVKAGVVILAALGLSKFVGRTAGAAAGIGGGILLTVDALREFVLPHLPVVHGGISGLGLGWDDVARMQGYLPQAGYLQRHTPIAAMTKQGLGDWGTDWGMQRNAS